MILEKVGLRIHPFFLTVEKQPEQMSMRDCRLCARAGEVGPVVLPAGTWKAQIAFVGHSPGEQEVRDGLPFNPDAPGGAKFVEYLNVLGVTRDRVYITNTCLCRGTNNRNPTPDEFLACVANHKFEFGRLSDLKVVVALGNDAFRLCTGMASSVHYWLGKYFVYKDGHEIAVVPLNHPGEVIRKPSLWPTVVEILNGVRSLVFDGAKV